MDMPDITMCCCKDCKKKDSCYRANASPSIYQSWSDFQKFCEKNDYKYYIKMERIGSYV